MPTPEITHVMVVDDEDDARAALTLCLQREGYRVTPCAHAGDFWQTFGASGADLVLLDVRMPGEDGYSIARRLRADRMADVGIIMVSALGDTVDKVVGLEVGADDYITKPFHCRELVARVHSVLRRHHPVPTTTPFGRLDEIVSKLDQLAGQVQQIDQGTRHIEHAVNATERTSCPQCGSPLHYHRAESGRLGICEACGWSHFVEG
ncbi:MAG: response regulator transcription factor [Pseudomonadota bacterium]